MTQHAWCTRADYSLGGLLRISGLVRWSSLILSKSSIVCCAQWSGDISINGDPVSGDHVRGRWSGSGVSDKVVNDVIAYVRKTSGVLTEVALLPGILHMMLDLHDGTWFRLDGGYLIETSFGSRKGCKFGVVIFDLMYCRVLDDLRHVLRNEGLLSVFAYYPEAASWCHIARFAPDGIASEIWIAGGSKLAELLSELMRRIVANGTVSPQWKDGRIARLYKGKDDAADCNSYRCLSIVDHASKVFSSLLQPPIAQVCDQRLPTEQCGCVRGRGTARVMHTSRLFARRAAAHKRPCALIFADLVKVFDRVLRAVVRRHFHQRWSSQWWPCAWTLEWIRSAGQGSQWCHCICSQDWRCSQWSRSSSWNFAHDAWSAWWNMAPSGWWLPHWNKFWQSAGL